VVGPEFNHWSRTASYKRR